LAGTGSFARLGIVRKAYRPSRFFLSGVVGATLALADDDDFDLGRAICGQPRRPTTTICEYRRWERLAAAQLRGPPYLCHRDRRGSYPEVSGTNRLVDGSFGFTAKILLDSEPSGVLVNSLEVPQQFARRVSSAMVQMVYQFLIQIGDPLNLSLDHRS